MAKVVPNVPAVPVPGCPLKQTKLPVPLQPPLLRPPAWVTKLRVPGLLKPDVPVTLKLAAVPIELRLKAKDSRELTPRYPPLPVPEIDRTAVVVPGVTAKVMPSVENAAQEAGVPTNPSARTM